MPVCRAADWVLPVDGDESKVLCRYCSRELNARYLSLLRHSLSNKHLCNAAAATVVSFPVDVTDNCEPPNGSTSQAQDDGLVDVDTELQQSSCEPEFDTSMLFNADTATENLIRGRRKVCHEITVLVSHNQFRCEFSIGCELCMITKIDADCFTPFLSTYAMQPSSTFQCITH